MAQDLINNIALFFHYCSGWTSVDKQRMADILTVCLYEILLKKSFVFK